MRSRLWQLLIHAAFLWLPLGLLSCELDTRRDVAQAEASTHHEIRVGATRLVVEVAADTQSRARGLMGRTSLGEDEGMLFVYPDDRELSYWMKDTPLPLSIAFIGKEGTILAMRDLEPFSMVAVPSPAPSRFTLEVSRGWFERHGVETGDRCEIPQRIQALARP